MLTSRKIHEQFEKDESFYFQNLADKLYFLYFIIHVTFIPLFHFVGVPELALFNCGSACLYLYLIYANAKGSFNFAYGLATIEVCLHAYMCSELLGDAGFSDAILFLPMLFFVNPTYIKVKISYFISVVLVYVALVFNDQLKTPAYDFTNLELSYFEIMTSILVVAIDSYIAFYAYSIIKKQKKALEA